MRNPVFCYKVLLCGVKIMCVYLFNKGDKAGHLIVFQGSEYFKLT